MKIWQRYLLKVWRWVRIPVAVVMTLYLCRMCLHQVLDSPLCAYDSRTVTPKQGNFRAVYIDKYCEGMGYGLTAGYTDMVVLRSRNGQGPDTRVFVYEPFDPGLSEEIHEPVMKWLSPNDLEISLDRVDRIYSRETEARGVRIIYRIGSVTHP